MALIRVTDEPRFDCNSIKKRDLVVARHSSWDEARNGIIEVVTDKRVVVYFLTGIHSCGAYFDINSDEVFKGEWELRYTSDLVDVKEIEIDNYCDCSCANREDVDVATKDDIDNMFDEGYGNATTDDIDSMFGNSATGNG